MTKPTTESGAPIEYRREDGALVRLTAVYAIPSGDYGGEETDERDAAAADLVAALTANPELRAQLLEQLTDGRQCHECGAHWMTDVQLDRMADKVDPYIKRAAAAESELTRMYEAFSPQHAPKNPREARQVLERLCDYESELAKCRAELDELREAARDVLRQYGFSDEETPPLHERNAISVLNGVMLSSGAGGYMLRQYAPATGDQDSCPTGQKETDHERDSARGLRRIRGLRGVEKLPGQPDAEVARATGEDSGSVASSDRSGAAERTIDQLIAASSLGAPFAEPDDAELDIAVAALRRIEAKAVAPATGDQEAAAVEPAPPEAPKLPGGLGPVDAFRDEIVAGLRKVDPDGWRFNQLADELERGRQR
jgi:hypothetical protein